MTRIAGIWAGWLAVAFAVATALALGAGAGSQTPAHAAPPPPSADLLPKALAGPMAGVEEVVFAARPLGRDPHWYANIGYYGPDANRKAYMEGGRLCKLNLKTGQVTVMLDDPKGGVRDPCVYYDGKRILFAYRKGGTENYHLYEINADGTGLKQLTDGAFDDFEPAYLPDDDIVFVSTRCKRWVNCWLTQVAIMYRCGPAGQNVHPISCNGEHDNTPWPLPDGRILYMRWEYVDRSQVHFHHLWVANPDGTGQMTYFGNMYPGTVMIDAKPIPGTDKVISIFSPGHGQKEHMGRVTIVDPNAGPDQPSSARQVSPKNDCRDPYAFSEDCFLVAARDGILLMDGRGATQVLARPTDALEFHEPRPLVAHPREKVIPPRADPSKATGRLVMADVNIGRSMEGVKPGEIKKLLVLEVLPMPVHFSGGMEPISQGGTFTLERILGTVPVEPDGSAYFEVPALRPVFFVAMDEHESAVKRMQSWCAVEPGETTGCVGCHEERTHTAPVRNDLAALRREPSRIEPVSGIPDVFDFPRDIQPILDRHCVKCHNCTERKGGIILEGDRGPLYSHSYTMLTWHGQVADGRNLFANRPPRSIGASASKLMLMLASSHYEVKVSDAERKIVRYWIESGAPYPGTYAALGSGMIGSYQENEMLRVDANWPSVAVAGEVIKRRCAGCHDAKSPLPRSLTDDMPDIPKAERRLHVSRHLAFNFTRPEKSQMLLGPLSIAAGGYGTCKARAEAAKPGTAVPDVFADTKDPDYQKLLALISDGQKYLDEHKRFDMPGFRPIDPYIREMKRYGILASTLGLADPVDPYATDRAYWQSFWHQPTTP